jgi:hypothetical protein
MGQRWGFGPVEWRLVVADAILVVIFLILVVTLHPFSSSQAPAPVEPSIAAEQTPEASVPADPTDPAEFTSFVLPSGNIWCEMSPTSAICTIKSFTFTAPEKPSDCDGTVGHTLQIEAGQDATMVCVVGDPPAAPAGAPTLEYGEASTVGQMTCHSSTNGATCRDNLSGKGFSVARAGYLFF